MCCRPYSAGILHSVFDQIQNLPNCFTTPNKMTSEDDIKGLVSLKFLCLCSIPWGGGPLILYFPGKLLSQLSPGTICPPYTGTGIHIHSYISHIIFFKYIFLGRFFSFFCSYNIQHCFICRPSDSTVPTDAGIEPRTVATCALAVRRSNHSFFILMCALCNLGIFTSMDIR